MLTVRSANDRDDERATVDQLLRLARAFDLTRFEFTSTVVIDAMAIPHSHPVLTLRASYRAIYRIVLDDLDRIEEVLRRCAIDIDHVDARRL